MMTVLFKSMIGLVIIGLISYIIRYFYLKTRVEVKSVKAGPTSCHCGVSDRTYFIGAFDTFRHNGKKINLKDYIVARVDGDCMSARGIYPGNIVFIEPFGACDKKEFKKGDILYIRYERDGFTGYKIREFDSVNGTDSVNTIYYTAENNVKRSHYPHRLENIEGIVRYNFAS